MSVRDDVLATLRRLQPAPVPMPSLPAMREAGVPAGMSHLEAFRAGLERMGGTYAGPAPRGDVNALVRERFPAAAVVCSAVPEATGNLQLGSVRYPRELDDVDVGIVRAAFGVAETGSVLLTDRLLGVSALGFLAQHLVVLLDPARIVANMHEAYRDPLLREAAYAVFMTGPSATADIEGVLIHGAQGARSLTVVAVAV